MRGIAGFFLERGAADPAAMRSMCDQIRHRVPDAEGVHIGGGCDLSTGHQPMSNGLRKLGGILAYAIWDALAYLMKRAGLTGSTWPQMLMVVGGVGIAYYAQAFRFCLENEHRRLLVDKLGRVLRRTRGSAVQ
jgi:hypothetical protein